MRRSEIIEMKYRHMAPASDILTCFLYHYSQSKFTKPAGMVNILSEV